MVRIDIGVVGEIKESMSQFYEWGFSSSHGNIVIEAKVKGNRACYIPQLIRMGWFNSKVFLCGKYPQNDFKRLKSSLWKTTEMA